MVTQLLPYKITYGSCRKILFRMKKNEIEQWRTGNYEDCSENFNETQEKEYYNCAIIKFPKTVHISTDVIKYVSQIIEYSSSASTHRRKDFFLLYGNLNNLGTIFEPKIEIRSKQYLEKDVLDCKTVTRWVLNVKLKCLQLRS